MMLIQAGRFDSECLRHRGANVFEIVNKSAMTTESFGHLFVTGFAKLGNHQAVVAEHGLLAVNAHAPGFGY